MRPSLGMRVIHAADLHIDSPLRGLRRLAEDGAPVTAIRLATRRAFAGLIDLCHREEAALLLLAGDIFDGEWRDFNTGLFFVRELSRLRESGTRVVMIRGNHDAESVISRSLPLPDHVRILAADAPETVLYDDLGIAVHGQSYRDRKILDNLARSYPPPRAGLLNLGLLHTNAVGASEHASYAPCTVGQLIHHGYDYWALGHVHQRQILAEAPSWVVYPGNLQGRHARETGAKGCVILEIEGTRITAVRDHDLDVIRWAEVIVTADAATDLDTLQQRLHAELTAARAGAAGRPLLVRVRIVGETALHADLLRDPEALEANLRATAAAIGDLWLERIVWETAAPPAADGASDNLTLLHALRQELARLRGDPEALETYLAGRGVDSLISGVRRHLPTLRDPEAIAGRYLPAIESLLRRQLGATKATQATHEEPPGDEEPRR